MNAIQKFNISIPKTYDASKEKKPLATLEDVRHEYTDACGGGARQVECFGRYRLTGVIERVHPLGVADVTIKGGMTLEVKTGHGWLIEPMFETLEELNAYLDERRNILLRASHIAYLPHRAICGEDFDDCLFFPAMQLVKILGQFGKLACKQDRDRWGVAIKPWITEGYAQKSSAKNEAEIREALEDVGLILEEFAEKHGIELYEY